MFNALYLSKINPVSKRSQLSTPTLAIALTFPILLLNRSTLDCRSDGTGVAAYFYVVGMNNLSFVALIGVEHRSLAVKVVDSELEIAGRFGSETC